MRAAELSAVNEADGTDRTKCERDVQEGDLRLHIVVRHPELLRHNGSWTDSKTGDHWEPLSNSKHCPLVDTAEVHAGVRTHVHYLIDFDGQGTWDGTATPADNIKRLVDRLHSSWPALNTAARDVVRSDHALLQVPADDEGCGAANRSIPGNTDTDLLVECIYNHDHAAYSESVHLSN